MRARCFTSAPPTSWAKEASTAPRVQRKIDRSLGETCSLSALYAFLELQGESVRGRTPMGLLEEAAEHEHIARKQREMDR